MKIKNFVLALCLSFGTYNSYAHSYAPTDTLPRVFVLGEYDDNNFEQLKKQYNTSLLEACRSDMEAAYYSWLHLLKYIESASKEEGMDLDGVKMWLYVFWNKDGTVQHIAYHLKPQSRNIDTKKLTIFLENFCSKYKLPTKSPKNFSNYSSASFPVLFEKKQ